MPCNQYLEFVRKMSPTQMQCMLRTLLVINKDSRSLDQLCLQDVVPLQQIIMNIVSTHVQKNQV
jgi:hypothetical protein